jgi:hypothetical protein
MNWYQQIHENVEKETMEICTWKIYTFEAETCYIVINISSSEVLLILSKYDFFIYHYYIALGRIF